MQAAALTTIITGPATPPPEPSEATDDVPDFGAFLDHEASDVAATSRDDAASPAPAAADAAAETDTTAPPLPLPAAAPPPAFWPAQSLASATPAPAPLPFESAPEGTAAVLGPEPSGLPVLHAGDPVPTAPEPDALAGEAPSAEAPVLASKHGGEAPLRPVQHGEAVSTTDRTTVDLRIAFIPAQRSDPARFEDGTAETQPKGTVAPPPANPAAVALPAPPLGDAAAEPADPGIPAYWQLRVAHSATQSISQPKAEAPASGDTTVVAALADPGSLIEAQTLPAQLPGPTPGHPFQPLQGAGAAPATLPPSLPAQLASVLSAPPGAPVELRLSPAELGRLRVRMTQDGDMLRVTIQVERPETLDLMRRHADVLLTEIRGSGFSGGDLSFAAWGGEGSGQQRPDRSVAPDEVPAIPGEPAPLPSPSSRASATGTLNLRL